MATPLSKMNKKQLYEECKKLKRDIDGDGMLYEGYKKELSNSNKQINRWCKDNVKLKQENEKLKEEMDTFKHQTIQDAYKTHYDTWKKEQENIVINELKEEIKKLKEENENLTDECGEHFTNHNFALEEITKLNETLEMSGQLNKTFNLSNGKLKLENKELKVKNIHYEEVIKILEGDKELLEIECDSLIESHNKLKEENKKLRIVMNWSPSPNLKDAGSDSD